MKRLFCLLLIILAVVNISATYRKTMFVGDTQPISVELGDVWVDTSGTATLKVCTSISPVTFTTSSGEAPLGATYITQISDTTLTGEQALSTLATGLMKVTTGTGVVSSVTSFAGDVTGAHDATVVGDDSHSHTGTTLSAIDISGDTNLTAGDALTLTDDDIDFDGGTAPAGELGGTWASPTIDSVHSGSAHHSAITLSGTPDYITLSGQDIVRGTIDVSDDTNLTVTAPVVLTGDTLSIPIATSSVDGYLDNADWTTFNNKEPAVATGAVTTYWRGDKSFQTLNWAAVDKTTSSIADIATRSAGDLSSGNLDVARMPTGGNWALTSNLNVNSNTLWIGDATNQVAIGTATPQTTDKLTVTLGSGEKVFITRGAEGSAALTVNGGYIYLTGGAFGFGTGENSDFAVHRNSAEIARFTSTNFQPNGAGTFSTGDGTNYWNDISYKTLTDRGCLGSFDAGVELLDGRIVSDVEAIKSIKADPTKLTVYGVPRLDYKTMPKAAYKPVPSKAPDGNDWLTDIDGRKYYNMMMYKDGRAISEKRYYEDGAETTALISILLGAIKELSTKQIELENRIAILEGKVP